jgi:hypothetical protein
MFEKSLGGSGTEDRATSYPLTSHGGPIMASPGVWVQCYDLNAKKSRCWNQVYKVDQV